MIFCKKCGSIITGETKKNGKAVCKCGYVSEEKSTLIKEEMNQKNSGVEVVEEKTETLPLTEVDCPKCGHMKAFYWTMQTRAADEGETKFLKCEECNHTWRDYG